MSYTQKLKLRVMKHIANIFCLFITAKYVIASKDFVHEKDIIAILIISLIVTEC
jgi:hypothetical protein